MAFTGLAYEPMIHQPAVAVAAPRSSARQVVAPRLVARTERPAGRNWAMLLTFSVICSGMVAAAGGSLYGLYRAGAWVAGLA